MNKQNNCTFKKKQLKYLITQKQSCLENIYLSIFRFVRWLIMPIYYVYESFRIHNIFILNRYAIILFFLLTESQKGYIKTAIVKNLNHDFSNNINSGITYRAIINPQKCFPGHIMQHIFQNAKLHRDRRK